MKVDVNSTQTPTPSQEVVAKAAETLKVTDGRSRVITLKKPGVLAQYRLIATLGALAENRTYVNMVMPLIFVAAIDDDDAIALGKMSEVEALIQRLGEDGIDTVMTAIKDHFGATDPEADRQALKK